MESTSFEHSPIDSEDADLDGDCPVCGKYRDKINRGKMKPCYMWQRIEQEDPYEDEE